MIINLIVFAIPAAADEYVFASNRTAQQIQLARDAESSWIAHTDVTAAQGFSAIRKLMNEDPIVHSFIEKITTQLQSHGVHQLEDVVRICPPDASTASGYTNFSAKLIEVRPKFPNQAEVPWSNVALESMREAYSYRIISRPFIEYLVIQSLPTVCVKADESIRRAYSIFVHEFVHFSQQDPFEDVVPKDTFELDDYLTSMTQRAGGELDAFKMQVGAEVRLLTRMGVLNPNINRPFVFANPNGEITDVEGLRNYIFSSYKTLFDTVATKSNLVKSIYENNIYRVSFLQQVIIPVLTNLNDNSSLNAAQSEIAKIEEANASLKSRYPDLL